MATSGPMVHADGARKRRERSERLVVPTRNPAILRTCSFAFVAFVESSRPTSTICGCLSTSHQSRVLVPPCVERRNKFLVDGKRGTQIGLPSGAPVNRQARRCGRMEVPTGLMARGRPVELRREPERIATLVIREPWPSRSLRSAWLPDQSNRRSVPPGMAFSPSWPGLPM